MEIPASKGMRDKKYNQLIRWTTTGFVISNCFWGFCPFVLPRISTHLSSKVWFGLEKRSFAEFWIWTFFASSWLKTKTGFWAFTTNHNHCSCTPKNNFPVLQCASVFWWDHIDAEDFFVWQHGKTHSTHHRVYEKCVALLVHHRIGGLFFGFSRFFFVGIPVIPKRLGFYCMFCLTDDHFLYANAFRDAPGLHAFGIF